MECNGFCHTDLGLHFKIVCPLTPSHLAHKLIIHKDGSSNKKYKELCQEPPHHATIAYNNDVEWFWIYKGYGFKFDLYPYPLHVAMLAGGYTQRSWDHEILSSFFENYHIAPSWIYNYGVWGWFDEEAGHWTGAVGMVLSQIKILSRFSVNLFIVLD